VEKAAIILGLGTEGVRKIEVGDGFEMLPQGLDRAIREDRTTGWTPMAVCATVGTTSTTSIDPVAAIGRICAREDIWLHVDAAYGGSMAVVPEFRWVLDGCEHADSVVINPHKWLFVPIDCSAFYTRRPEVVKRAFSLVPPYLMTPEGDEATNLMDYGPSLGRRFRALKLWMVIRAFGVQGIAERIRTHVGLARTFARWVDETPGWERLAPTPMSTVLFRHLPAGPSGPEGPARSGDPQSRGPREEVVDRHNRELLDRINASGRAFLSHTQVRGRLALRLAVGNLRTTEEDVRQTWDLLRELAQGA
jgi:aromatic-L-amino-acid decarboxylase